MDSSCSICDKHRGAGPLVGPTVWADDDVVVTHRPVGADGTTVLGYLYVETRRHAPYLADLTDREAEKVGKVVRRAALSLRTELAADYVFSVIVGRAVAHFHQHLFVRHTGTPADYDWLAGDEWPEAPRETASDVENLCARLRIYFDEP